MKIAEINVIYLIDFSVRKSSSKGLKTKRPNKFELLQSPKLYLSKPQATKNIYMYKHLKSYCTFQEMVQPASVFFPLPILCKFP